ncbi:MAG: hypothetical protein ABIT71_23120 [Vicinamibacteraceae bacterium]
MHSPSLRCRIAGAAFCVVLGYPLPGIAGQAPSLIAAPTIPTRTSPLPALAPTAALPPEALGLEPIAFTVVRRTDPRQAVEGAIEQVTRTADRVHVRLSPTREWLYVRNPLDARRVSAVMIDHDQRALVTYEESDLRNTRGIRGWLDVLTVGLDPDAVRAAAVTTDVRTIDGVAFTRYVTRSASGSTSDMWWSQAELMPSEVVSADANGNRTTWLSVRDIRRTIDTTLLAPPATRFPTYREVAYPDWLEGLP